MTRFLIAAICAVVLVLAAFGELGALANKTGPGECFGAPDGSKAEWITDARDIQVYEVSSWSHVLPSVCGHQ